MIAKAGIQKGAPRGCRLAARAVAAAFGCFCLAAVPVGTPPVASAQAQYVSQVRTQLNRIAAIVAEKGYEKSHEYKIDKLPRDGTDSFTLTLHENVEYILLSVCDRDCTDVDIKVFDENENQVAADDQRDDVPVVEVTPRWTGTFRIQVRMYRCNNNPCYYGIGVFAR